MSDANVYFNLGKFIEAEEFWTLDLKSFAGPIADNQQIKNKSCPP
jgi:hypothetical protein